MIPRWLIDQRHATCLSCLDKGACQSKYGLLQADPACPLGKLPTLADAIAARAWPEGAPAPSDCCGSAEYYAR